MHIPWKVPCTCRGRRSQRGFASFTALCLLLVLAFMGRGLVYFSRQGAESARIYHQEMQLRLAGESLVEQQVFRLKQDSSPLASLAEKTDSLLERGDYDGLPYRIYGRRQGDRYYIMAYTFCRESEWDKRTEPHFLVKGVLKKDGEQYKWLGWAP